MSQFRTTFQVSRSALPRPNVPAVQRALHAVMATAATFAKALWYQRAQDLRIRASGAYLQGIQDAAVRVVSDKRNGANIELVFEIVNSAPHAAIVEHGHPAFSLPESIDWNSFNGSIKRAKDGTPYLNIPFTHAAYASAAQRQRQGLTVATVKRMLPEDVYREALSLAPTTRLGTGPVSRIYEGAVKPTGAMGHGMGRFVQPTGNGGYRFVTQHMRRDTYTRGGRLDVGGVGPQTRMSPSGENVEWWRGARAVTGRARGGAKLMNPAWKGSKFGGLFRSTVAGGGSRYMTIRTVTPHSEGWNIPAQQGLGVARQVAGALNGGPGHARLSQLLAKTAADALLSGAP